LPLEHGLRLIAADLDRGGLSRTIELVAAELERGTPLAEAFEMHRVPVSALYGRLVAPVKSGNLPGVLFNLGRPPRTRPAPPESHLAHARYPVAVLIGLAIVLDDDRPVCPAEIRGDLQGFALQLPAITQLLINTAHIVPILAIITA